jgi:hypothetical protein
MKEMNGKETVLYDPRLYSVTAVIIYYAVRYFQIRSVGLIMRSFQKSIISAAHRARRTSPARPPSARAWRSLSESVERDPTSTEREKAKVFMFVDRTE